MRHTRRLYLGDHHPDLFSFQNGDIDAGTVDRTVGLLRTCFPMGRVTTFAGEHSVGRKGT